ncbi:MAG TPA: site-2 protease family protein [Thermoanaerobaculia bacterium]|nr:site-2 protease family protein [Thermoanaerobaculia bacterium]
MEVIRGGRAEGKRRPLDRHLAVTAGILLALLGFGLTALMGPELGRLPFVFFIFVGSYLIIGSFGLDLLIQGVRGASLRSGLFYRAMKRLHPSVVSIGGPVLLGITIAAAARIHDAVSLLAAEALGAVWVALIVNVAVHELGHFIAGRLVGLAFQRVVIGPMEIVRTARGWRPRLCRQWFSAFGGLVVTAATPVPTARQSIVLAAGGPAGTFCLLLFVVAVNPYRYGDLLNLYKPGPALVFFGALGAIITLVLNLIPSTKTLTICPTDGFVIRRNLALLRREKA